jgi:molecular chaperone HscB
MPTENSPSSDPQSHALADDPFAILGIDPAFDLDLRVLRARWMKAAAQVHPDVAGASHASARVNDAFRALSHPLSRAEALLSKFGLWALAEQDEVKRALPVGFLVEMMEFREEVDALQPTDTVARASLREVAKSRRDSAIAGIASAFRALAQSPSDEIARTRAVREVVEWANVVRSFDRMTEQLDREFGMDSP